MISMLAGENLRELILKCNGLVEDHSFQSAVAKASGCSEEEVSIAFVGAFENPQEMIQTLKALNTIYQKLIEKFPQRNYERVMDLGNMEDPAVEETVSF